MSKHYLHVSLFLFEITLYFSFHRLVQFKGREMGDAAWLAVRMEGGAAIQGCGASRSWKRQEPVLPGASGGTGPAHRGI